MTLEQSMLENAPFSLPALPYATDSLEPNIDKMTMEIRSEERRVGKECSS